MRLFLVQNTFFIVQERMSQWLDQDSRRNSQDPLSPTGPRTLHAENTPSFSSFFARGKLRACAFRWLARCCWLSPGRTGSLLPPATLPAATGGAETAATVAAEGALACGVREPWVEVSGSAMMPGTLGTAWALGHYGACPKVGFWNADLDLAKCRPRLLYACAALVDVF